jgi:hypothetical protein
MVRSAELLSLSPQKEFRIQKAAKDAISTVGVLKQLLLNDLAVFLPVMVQNSSNLTLFHHLYTIHQGSR